MGSHAIMHSIIVKTRLAKAEKRSAKSRLSQGRLNSARGLAAACQGLNLHRMETGERR